MVIFHSYVSLPEGTLTVKPVEVESYRSPFTAGMFYSHQIPSMTPWLFPVLFSLIGSWLHNKTIKYHHKHQLITELRRLVREMWKVHRVFQAESLRNGRNGTSQVLRVYYHNIIYYHMLSYAIICYHMLSYAIICYHFLLSYTVIYYHILSYDTIYYHALSYDTIYYHALSYTIMHYHLLSFTIM